jgi:plastocyanin
MPPGSQFLTTTAYIPNPINVSMGTTVTFVNNDNVAHTATSQNNLWDTGDIQPGRSQSLTFRSTGSFPYYCIYHPRMVGTITVQ